MIVKEGIWGLDMLHHARSISDPTPRELADALGLDPASDFQYCDLREIDITSGDFADFNFRGALITDNEEELDSNDEGQLNDYGMISSIGELHKIITGLFEKRKDADAKTLVEQYFPKSGGSPLRGTPDDFFITATQLSRSDLEPLAWRVLEVGLSLFPNNADMLATGMKHALDAGFPEKARELYDRAAKLLPEQKNWRLWVFMGSYLEDAASEDEVHRFYKDYIDRFIDSQGELREPAPNDAMEERVLAKFAAYLVKMARRREAKDVCLLAADHIARVPQCAANLADIYLEEGEYDNAIKFSEKALRDDRRDQSHISAAARHLTIGLAKDARLQSNTPESLNALRKDLRDVFLSYGAVLRSGRNIPAYTFSIREQVNSVISFAETHGLDREQIIACMGPELRALINLAVDDTDGTKSSATQSGDNGFSQKEILLAAKTISELDEGNRSEPLSRLVEQLRGLDQTEQIKVLLTQAAEHFANDPDEAKFVAVLREIASRL